MSTALDSVRVRIVAPIQANCKDKDFEDLVRLMRRFVDDLMGLPERNSRNRRIKARSRAIGS